MGEFRIDANEFRQLLGHWPTGVAVITGGTAEAPVGLAANSFTSVSLDPPLIGFFPAKTSSTWPLIREGGTFCVNILAGHHQELSRQFARRGENRFEGVPWTMRDSGPALDEAVAWIDCEIHSELEAGDHTLVLGRVVGFGAQDDLDPLVFHRGRYGAVVRHPVS